MHSLSSEHDILSYYKSDRLKIKKGNPADVRKSPGHENNILNKLEGSMCKKFQVSIVFGSV